ncbi:efflux RND transporter permease subunit [Mucilaginibacter sp. HMF5004]|uniref:efflux RND transporter permease subunit n=1 Tax=Mucilaginibacter rivuli TaxID=2857527 RepID=UPI001C5F1ED0|nr:efflux RND transporter permease subunit [Mucilaginibacter rivuli]MBW4888926.1 efflux RND transporter permease subunit [Mucilaginibacter rivuli]
MTLTEISIKRPSLIIVIFMVLILGGIFCYTKLSYELLPDMSQPTLVVTTQYPGAAPVNVEQSVSKKMEDVLSGVDGIKSISSQSMEGNSIITAEFSVGTDINSKEQEVQRKINNILSGLPTDVKSPGISKVTPSDAPIMQLAATSKLSNSDFYDVIKNEINPQLQQIAGVGEINLVGGQEREIQVNVVKDKLDYYGISILNVTQAINNANVEFPAGKVKSESTGQMTVRLAGKFTSISQLNDLTVALPASGSPVKLSDVATVADVTKEPSSVFRYNGQTAIGLMIKKQGDANAVEISKQVKAKISDIEKKFTNSDIKFIIADDSADYTLDSANGVMHDLIIAIILVAVIMLLFLHSLRDSLIVLIAIPTSLISTFIAMYLFGFSLNLMSLLALSLVIGILVDDSIVILENIHRHLLMGKDKRTAALDGRNEIGFSALAITTVDVVVFGPLCLIQNTIGDLLRQYSLTIVVATLMSLFVCYTLTPWLASRFGKITVLNNQNLFHKPLVWFEQMLGALTKWYEGALKWSLKHKLIMAGIIVALFGVVAVVMSMGVIGSEFVAETDKGQFRLALEYDKSLTVKQNNLRSIEIENYLRKQLDVVTVFSNVAGSSTSSLVAGVGSDYKTELTITLIDKKQRSPSTEQLMLVKSKEISRQFPGVKVKPSMVSMVNGGEPIQIVLNGENNEQLMAAATELKERIAAMPGAINTSLSVEIGNPEVEVNIDREKMGQLGLNIYSVGVTLQNAYAGNNDAKYRVGNNEYDIRVKFDDFDKHDVEDVKNISFMNNSGQPIKLSQFAAVDQSSGPSVLERKDRRASVTVKSNILGITSGEFVDRVNQSLKQKPLPAGIDLRWTGDAERQSDSFGSLAGAIVAALILMYLVMVALYNNFIYPFVVLFAIPVAFVGVFLALALTKSSLSIFAILGMIMLLGLVSKNAILIVDFANHRKEQGDSTWTALISAGTTRLRPILMTTLTMIIGMIPIATSTAAGSEWKNGLAWVLIGGLTTSLCLTVFIVPIVYYCVDRIRDKWRAKKPSNEITAKVFPNSGKSITPRQSAL